MAQYLNLAILSMASLLILMVLYALYIVKLRWHLEENHELELEKLNLGKKISRFMYYSTPAQAINVMKFIFSDHNLGDQKILFYKKRLRTIIGLAIVWCVCCLVTLLLN